MSEYTASPWQLPSSWNTKDSSSNDRGSEIVIERNANRQSVAYACEDSVTEEDDGWEDFHRRTTILSQYYELLYPCDTDDLEDAYVKPIARHTMDELATDLDLLPSGAACSEDHSIRGVAKGNPDVLRHNIPCETLPYQLRDSLVASSIPQCCQTVQMGLEVLLDEADTEDDKSITVSLQESMARILNEPSRYLPVQTLAIADPTLRVQHETSVDANESRGEFHILGDQELTITGGALVGLLLTFLFSFFIVAYRRSRRCRTHHHRMIDYQKDDWQSNEDDMHNMESTVELDSSEYSSHQNGACGIYRDPAHDNTSCYSMAESLRESIFWREQSYQVELDEISEADSWAQTDATVGSLEERLEQITAEI